MPNYDDIRNSAFRDELEQIMAVNEPVGPVPVPTHPNSATRAGKIPEHIETFLAKRASVVKTARILPKTLKPKHLAGGAAATILGWEGAKRLNRDRALGRQVRIQSQQAPSYP